MKKFFLVAIVLSSVTQIITAEPAIWKVDTKAEVLKGEARNVSIDNSGAIGLAPKFTEVFKTGQPYIWSTAINDSGHVFIGTGGDGKIFRVANGSGSLFADLAELNVSALAAAPNGELFAATSPDGRVYKIDSAGKSSIFFEPKEKYIWSILVMNDGSLVIGSGERGKIFRVKQAGESADAALLFDSSDSHIISLAKDSSGSFYAGTDSNGLVLKFGSDGKPFAILDSPLREIHEFSVASDGSVYVLALGDSATAASTSPVVVTDSKPTVASRAVPVAIPIRSRYDLTGAKSAVYRIQPDGTSELIWTSNTVVGFSINANQPGNVLLGTSDKGRIYNLQNDGRETLVVQSDASQISTITNRGTDIFAATSNQGTLFKLGPDVVSEGSYESSVLDAGNIAAWGRIWWRSAGTVEVHSRSGNTERPDETWSSWSAVIGNSGGPITSPKAKFLQWRAVLKAGSQPIKLYEVSTSYLPKNIAPEVLAVNILPANIGLVANPSVFVDPNIGLSGIDPQTLGTPIIAQAPRRILQRAARSFQWQAEDRNGDRLVFDVYFKEVSDANYKLMKENLAEPFITLDGLSLPDGQYTIKVVAKDTESNPNGQSLFGDRISEPFDIDNTQPTVTAGGVQTSGNKSRVQFSASDAGSFLARAEFSVNGGEWRSVYSDDGISDSPKEVYTVEIIGSTGREQVITLRVFDSSGNAGNARAIVRN